jgi:cysteine desulfuration protein SufE
MDSLENIGSTIVEEFSLFDNWTDRYEFLIDMGKSLPPLDEESKTDEHLVQGCQSRVWLTAKNTGSRIQFSADSDTVITKGMIAMLIRVLSDRKPEEILTADLSFIDKIGLKEHLSPTRSNGLLAMIRDMKRYAALHIENSKQ